MLNALHRSAVRLPAAGVALVLALSACSSKSDDAEPGSTQTPAPAGEAVDVDELDDAAEPDEADDDSAAESNAIGGAFPPLEDMPTCEEIHALLGAPIADLAPDPNTEPPETFEDALRYGINCSWFSPEALNPSTDVFEDGAGISLQVMISEQPDDKQTFSDMDWVADDPRLDGVGGFIMTIGQDYDPAEPLAVVSPQVVIGRASFTFASMGVMLTDAESLAHLTNDWAVEASLAIHGALTGARAQAEQNTDTAPTESPEPRTYTAGETIKIELTMKSSADGGRQTAFSSNYRPTAEFTGNQPSTCSISLTDISQFEPGATHVVEAVCANDITVEPAATDVDLVEGGAVRGSGTVLLPVD